MNILNIGGIVLEHSKLSDHKFKKGKFTTPFNEAFSGLASEVSWYHDRLPEYIWIILILDRYDRKEAFGKCQKILEILHNLAPTLLLPRLSEILKLQDDCQKKFYNSLLSVVSAKVLAPLTVIFTYSEYPCFASTFCTSDSDVEERIEKITTVMKKTSDHQTNFSTDIRFLVLYFSLISERLCMQKKTLDLILEYPSLSHEHEKMRLIRPMIRSSEMSPTSFEKHNEKYLALFWERVSRMTECELFCINIPKEESNKNEYKMKVKNILQYYSELMISTKLLDNKMLVLLGIATYSYKRLLELIDHNLYNTISGRSIARILIEDYIMMKYLLQEEPNHPDIWTEYQYYGIGQYKLIVERVLQSGKDTTDNHIMADYLNILISEYKDKEYIDMDTSYFDKKNVREKAISVGEKDLFGLFYDYDSAFEHGLWGAIRESTLIKCNSPAHQYHCVPDTENNQKLKSVWKDCHDVMNKTLSILEGIYGLPAHLKVGDESAK